MESPPSPPTLAVLMKNVKSGHEKFVGILLLVTGQVVGILPDEMQKSIRNQRRRHAFVKLNESVTNKRKGPPPPPPPTLHIYLTVTTSFTSWKSDANSHMRHLLDFDVPLPLLYRHMC